MLSAGLAVAAVWASPTWADSELTLKAWAVIEQRCLSCHGATDTKGHLRLDLAATRQKTALPGNPIFGDLERSELLRRIQSDDPAYRMPKDETPLTTDEIETVREWISQGFEFPASVAAPSNLRPVDSPISIWEKYSREIDYAQKIHDSIGVFYLPFLVFLILILLAERSRRSLSKKPDAKPSAAVSVLNRFGRTQYLMVGLGFALATVVRLDRAKIAAQREEIETLRDQFEQLTGSSADGQDKVAGIPIYRPKHPPRLGGEYYRGNDERSPDLFNGGYYRTARMEVALENSERVVLKWNDEVGSGDLFIRLTVEKAPFATPSLFVEDNMQRCYLAPHGEADDGPPNAGKSEKQPAFLKSVEEGKRWEARYRLGSLGDSQSENLTGRLYLSPGGGPHYGIVYDLKILDGKIDESSEIWMGSAYLTGSVVVPKPDSIPLAEWFDFLPIPEITHEQTEDPKLLGIEKE